VRSYLAAALADNTLRAYRNDLKHFIDWGGAIPATPECVANYLAGYATILSCATLSRRVVAIGRAHTTQGLLSPAHSELVTATLQGIRRIRGRPPRQVTPLLMNDVAQLVLGLKGLRGLRDKALLLIGFAGALRRSELVSLDVGDVQFVAEGALIRLRRSKTDQEGRGRVIAIPCTGGRECPPCALRAWLQKALIGTGALFRRINQYDQLLPQRLSAQSVALVIKERAAAAGLDAARYSGHSLRAGFATNAAKAGASALSIRAQTGHKSDAMLQRYIRDGDLFRNNPNLKIWSSTLRKCKP
jgi:site-specific recombinase XerD